MTRYWTSLILKECKPAKSHPLGCWKSEEQEQLSARMWRNLKPHVLLGACPAGPATLADSRALQQRVSLVLLCDLAEACCECSREPCSSQPAKPKARPECLAAGAAVNEGWSARAGEYCSAVKGSVGLRRCEAEGPWKCEAT